MYSGSDDVDEVAQYYSNSGDKTHEVGKKRLNELGIYDMSEMCGSGVPTGGTITQRQQR